MSSNTNYSDLNIKPLLSVGGTLIALSASMILTLAPALGQQVLRVQSPEAPILACPVCPQPGNKTDTHDFTCTNPAVKQSVRNDIGTCLGCSEELRNQARRCGMSDTRSSYCPTCELPETGCRLTSCPSGQSLWDRNSPSCSCKPNADVCSLLGGEISKIGVVRKHWDSSPPDSIWAFTWAHSGAAIKSANALATESKCLGKAYDLCWENFRNQFPLGKNALMQSYREGGDLKYLDTCVAESLELSGDIGLAHSAGNGKWGYNAWSGSNYLDANCRPIPNWQKDLITRAQCNTVKEINFNELSSPVSLLWAPDVMLKDINSRVRFPLNPAESGHWFVWKGSGLTPLVVWDPEERGSITKASQLFGNHTWGKSWKNGYEPLASLDADQNGWLEQEELKNIAIWFDFNQDGISDKGEVKSLSSVSIEAIGVTISQAETDRGLIFADKGFRRKIGDEIVQGRSVDWFGGLVKDRLGSEALHPPIPTGGRVASASKEVEHTISGFWNWRAVDFTGRELPENLPSGSFILFKDNNDVAGTAYISNRLAPNKAGLGETIDASGITGSTFKTNEGNTHVSFSTKTAFGGTVTSEAELAADGETLAGVTTEELGPDKDKTTYAWIAQRRSE
jgi:hypothetical protein